MPAGLETTQAQPCPHAVKQNVLQTTPKQDSLLIQIATAKDATKKADTVALRPLFAQAASSKPQAAESALSQRIPAATQQQGMSNQVHLDMLKESLQQKMTQDVPEMLLMDLTLPQESMAQPLVSHHGLSQLWCLCCLNSAAVLHESGMWGCCFRALVTDAICETQSMHSGHRYCDGLTTNHGIAHVKPRQSPYF